MGWSCCSTKKRPRLRSERFDERQDSTNLEGERQGVGAVAAISQLGELPREMSICKWWWCTYLIMYPYVYIYIYVGLGPNPTSWWTRVGRSLGARFTSAMEAFVAIIVCSLHLFGVPFFRWCPAVSFRRPDLPSILHTLTTCQLRAWKLWSDYAVMAALHGRLRGLTRASFSHLPGVPSSAWLWDGMCLIAPKGGKRWNQTLLHPASWPAAVMEWISCPGTFGSWLLSSSFGWLGWRVAWQQCLSLDDFGWPAERVVNKTGVLVFLNLRRVWA